jgi:maleylacetoacetate isomerase
VLYDYWRSSTAYRIRIALNLKGIAYDSVPVDLLQGNQRAAEFRVKNPQGLVPVLEMDGHRFTQSLAILDYLDTAVPEPRFVPADPVRRAQVLAMALIIACDIHPLNNLRVLRYLKTPIGADDAARDAWYVHWLEEGLAALETLAVAHAGAFLSGERPGIADICLVPQLYNARRFKVAVEAYPTLARIDAAACGLPAFADAHPDAHAPAAAG